VVYQFFKRETTMDEMKINEDLLQKVLQIKQNEKKPIKRGFKTWLKYIYNYKSESLSL
jgi:hypothetical protein